MRGRLPDSLTAVPLVILAALAGLLIGSFLNVCIYRIPRDMSVVFPRSFCPECEGAIAPLDNVPLFSFLLLRGLCRHCGTRISFRYPAVELITAVLFALVVLRYGPTVAALKWLIFESLLVALFWTDCETELLPDELTLGGTAAAVILALFVRIPGTAGEMLSAGLKPVWPSLANLAAGAFFLAVPIWLLGAAFGRILKQEALGLGDVKLLLMLGSFLGLDYGLQALMAGTIAGAVSGAFWAIITRKKAFTQRLRFGCFLCGAGAFVPLLNSIGTS